LKQSYSAPRPTTVVSKLMRCNEQPGLSIFVRWSPSHAGSSTASVKYTMALLHALAARLMVATLPGLPPMILVGLRLCTVSTVPCEGSSRAQFESRAAPCVDV